MVPCLAIGLYKNDKIKSIFVPFPGFVGHYESVTFFKLSRQTSAHKSLTGRILSIFPRPANQSTILQESDTILTKREGKSDSSCVSDNVSKKNPMFLYES